MWGNKHQAFKFLQLLHAYPQKPWLMTPYKNTGNLTRKQVSFDNKLSKATLQWKTVFVMMFKGYAWNHTTLYLQYILRALKDKGRHGLSTSSNGILFKVSSFRAIGGQISFLRPFSKYKMICCFVLRAPLLLVLLATTRRLYLTNCFYMSIVRYCTNLWTGYYIFNY